MSRLAIILDKLEKILGYGLVGDIVEHLMKPSLQPLVERAVGPSSLFRRELRTPDRWHVVR